MANIARQASRRQAVFAEPSRRMNTTQNQQMTSSSASTSSNTTFTCPILPKLMDPECQLLWSNKGCFKC
jgi:hypothetical protein